MATSSSDENAVPLEARGLSSGNYPTADDADEADPTLLEARPAALTSNRGDVLAEARYAARAVLGEGGMGEVRLVHDHDLGREVAMKVLLPSRKTTPRARDRFLREARVQGMLEHPSIVPVYEVGETPTGDPYFTMKRVRGMTLAEVLDGLRRGDARIASRFTRRKLVGALAQVCLAMDFAHARGVVHRDLKPANVMLGDYGEVYVLDWGLAGFVGTARIRLASVPPVTLDSSREILGTPGYMAPEQIDAIEDCDGAADVYGLGALLFEVLTLEPLHTATRVRQLLDDTRRGVDARASVRTPARRIPAELDELCVRAVSVDPLKRPSAREMNEALEAFLDGDRESEQRLMMAELHANAAREAVRRVRAGGPGSLEARREAIRGLGRALALDPRHGGARRALLKLFSAPIDEVPAEVEQEVLREQEQQSRVASSVLRVGRFSWILYLPLIFWMGLRDASMLGLVVVLALVSVLMGGLVEHYVRSSGKDQPPHGAATLRTLVAVVSLVFIFPLATMFGPLVMLPAVAVASVLPTIVHLGRRGGIAATVAACLAVLVPAMLEWAGVLPPSYAFDGETITILPRMLHFPPLASQVSLIVLAIAPVLTGAILVHRVRAHLDSARRRSAMQMWLLRQLLPEPRDEQQRDSLTSMY